jgi:hypothetical protein
MHRLACLTAATALLLSPDVTGVPQLQRPEQSQPQIPQDQSVPVLPNFDKPASQEQPAAKKDGPLQEESRLEILRFVDGEFARMVMPLPSGKKGFRIKAGQPIDRSALLKAIRASGAAVNPGDNVQITKLDFTGREIMVDLNGGGRGHSSWRQHVQLGIGLPTQPVQTSTTTTPQGGAGPVVPPQKTGATLYLDFGRSLPDMTPDQVKQYLSAVLDFSKQRSAAVQWSETLPPKIQAAISEKRPEVGMDRDEVLAAVGRPERKVREREPDGTETEDWIYGRPPAKTIFVRFVGDKVTQVDQYQ